MVYNPNTSQFYYYEICVHYRALSKVLKETLPRSIAKSVIGDQSRHQLNTAATFILGAIGRRVELTRCSKLISRERNIAVSITPSSSGTALVARRLATVAFDLAYSASETACW